MGQKIRLRWARTHGGKKFRQLDKSESPKGHVNLFDQPWIIISVSSSNVLEIDFHVFFAQLFHVFAPRGSIPLRRSRFFLPLYGKNEGENKLFDKNMPKNAKSCFNQSSYFCPPPVVARYLSF